MKKSEIQIFLAHAKEDKEAVSELYDRLNEAGYKPWLDEKDLLPGQNWQSEISRVIKNSQLFIACLSKRSIAKQGFVQQEFRMAINQAAKLPSESIYLIPLRLDDCEIPDLRQNEYGLNLRDIHWLNYWEVDGFDKLEKAISHQYESFAQDQSFSEDVKEQKPSIPQKSDDDRNSSGVHKPQVEKLEEVRRKKSQDQYLYLTEDLGNGIKLEVMSIPGGTFFMGSPGDEGSDFEKPQHEVTVSSFYMGKYPITQAQYQKVMGKNLSKFKSDDRPVEQVTWDEAVDFCKKLSNQTGKKYRLPTEAEWEYACRAGTTTSYYFDDTITKELANYRGNETTSAGQFSPNIFGLYDMHGNVWEWCQDNWHENYNNAPHDGTAWFSGDNTNKVRRGGSWFSYPDFCRSAYRSHNMHDDHFDNLGFRVVCTTDNLH